LGVSWWEALGFASGAVCVWLIVKENVWNWPLGMLNNVLYFVVFFRSRLYADMLLQGVFFALGAYGWLHWLYGGARKDDLAITRLRRAEWIALGALLPVATLFGSQALARANDASPFLDALTTALSLAAQYFMTLKRIEHWWLWIAADILYIPLYLSRMLPLTAVLYFGFLLMCIAGLLQWRRSLSQ
jgi:nicotinamide mononucleotide transporter